MAKVPYNFSFRWAKQKENGEAKPCLIEEVGGDELQHSVAQELQALVRTQGQVVEA